MENSTGKSFIGTASVARKLGLAFLALLVLLVIMAGFGAWRLEELNAVTTRIVAKDMRAERIMGEWIGETRANSVRAVVLTHSDDADLKRLFTPPLEAATKRITELQKEIENQLSTPEAKTLFDDIAAKRKTYIEIRTRVLEHKKAGRIEEANRLLELSMLPAVATYQNSIQMLGEHYTHEAEKNAAAAAAASTSGRNVLVLVCAIGLLLGMVLSWRITVAITGPIRQAVAAALRVANGDLTVRVEAHSNDETGQLLMALQRMQDQLSSTLQQIKGASGTVNQAAREIAAGNSELSSRTEEQASALEETAASMEEMTATVSQNADNAKKANVLAAQASGVAVQGGVAVREVVETMEGITQSSKKIADIIGVIDGIAFQTNILALNAAVEAARAGEQGRGFAVVASEVRSLAQRSAAAAKEIKGLITDSVSKVETGSRQVDAAGAKIEEVVSSVKRVSNLIAEIAAASQEQSQGIEQVSDTVTQMEKVTQQNAAMVEEASAAAGSLEEQAGLLDEAVGAFKIDAHATQAPARPAPVAPRAAAPMQTGDRARAPASLPRKRPTVPELPSARDNTTRKTSNAKSEGWEEF